MEGQKQDTTCPKLGGAVQKFIRHALAGKIEKELKIIEAPYVYYTGKPKDRESISWTDAYRLMETYGLDSTDAMILNFALSMGFHGLVTCDGDFRTVNNISDFNIYMPQRLVGSKKASAK